MMKILRFLVFSLLIIYSITLIATEIFSTNDLAPSLFSPISKVDGSLISEHFYAVNTTLSVFLYWSVALVFVICMLFSEEEQGVTREQYFYLTQVLIFILMGMSYRFMLHKMIAAWFGFAPGCLILGLAIFEFFLVVNYNNSYPAATIGAPLYLAFAFWLLVAILETFGETKFTGHLSLANLSRTWSGILFFCFAWRVLYTKIMATKSHSHSLTSLIVVRRSESEKKQQPLWMK